MNEWRNNDLNKINRLCPRIKYSVNLMVFKWVLYINVDVLK